MTYTHSSVGMKLFESTWIPLRSPPNTKSSSLCRFTLLHILVSLELVNESKDQRSTWSRRRRSTTLRTATLQECGSIRQRSPYKLHHKTRSDCETPSAPPTLLERLQRRYRTCGEWFVEEMGNGNRGDFWNWKRWFQIHYPGTLEAFQRCLRRTMSV